MLKGLFYELQRRIGCKVKKIIKIKEGDSIPENGKFLSTEQKKEFAGQEIFYKHGFFSSEKITKTEYKLVTYFYYEVDEAKNEN